VFLLGLQRRSAAAPSTLRPGWAGAARA